MQQGIYTSKNSEYLKNNNTWHVEDSPWKARQVFKIIKRNKLEPKTIAEIGCSAREILVQLENLMIGSNIDFEKYDQSDSPANEFMRSTLLGTENRLKTLTSNIQALYGNSKHLWMWDYNSLAFELKKVGFVNVRRCEFGDSTGPYFNLV